MANSRRCANNHVYDADLYPSCPYCSNQGNSIQFGDFGFGAPESAAMDTPSATVMPGMGASVYPSRIVPQNPEEMAKTVAPEDYLEQQQREGHTVAVFQETYDMDPVVGWIVCIDGPDQGKSYQLYARVNLIGRGEKADVVLKDMTVSKEQVKVGYDERHNNFYLIPGDSKNTTYLNDVPLYVPTPVNAYDLIEAGKSKLMFIPFCGEKFRWSSVIKSGE